VICLSNLAKKDHARQGGRLLKVEGHPDGDALGCGDAVLEGRLEFPLLHGLDGRIVEDIGGFEFADLDVG